MDTPGYSVILYPSCTQVLEMNRQLIDLKGGEYSPPFNLRNPGSVDLILDTIQEEIFNTEMYPGLYKKVAILIWKIIVGHIFMDGNKRTGMMAGLFMMAANGRPVKATQDEIVKIALRIATYHETGFTENDLEEWLRQHS